jgi:small conductance mechanosensitive channel
MVMERVAEWLSRPVAHTAFRVLLLLAIGLGASWLVRKPYRRLTARFDETLATLLVKGTQVVIWLVVILTIGDALGIDTKAFLTSLGVLGLTLGFAAQDTLGNIISGFFILLDRPFVIGDLVTIDGEYGRVDSITLRSVRVVTPDGRMVAIPNRTVANAKAVSYTNFPHLRIEIAVTISTAEDIGRARAVLLGLVRDRPEFLRTPEPFVAVTNLGDYAVSLLLAVWLGDERNHIQVRYALREQTFEALRSAGIDMPLETIKVLSQGVGQPRDSAHAHGNPES